MDNNHENTGEYNPDKEQKILIVFHDMIPDMLSKKKRQQKLTKSFIVGRKLNISLVSIAQFYFALPENVTVIPAN